MDKVVEEYKKKYKNNFSLDFFSSKEDSDDFEDCDKQVSMFAPKRLIVIKEAFSFEKIKNNIIKNYERMIKSDNIFVLYEEGEIRKNDKLLKILLKEKDNVMIQEFSSLPSSKISLWIKKEFAKNGVEVTDEAVAKISEIGGSDTWKIKNEVEKLSLYGKKIERKDVISLVSLDTSTDIFKTIDAVASKDSERALFFIYDHLKKGDNPLYLLSMLGYQFRNLIIVKSLLDKNLPYEEMKKKSNLHPFVFKKSCDQAKKFSFDELRKIYENLFNIDLKTKTGQIDPVLALHLFIFECGD